MPGIRKQPGMADAGQRRRSRWGFAALFCTLLSSAPALAPVQAQAQTTAIPLAITVDDLPVHGPVPKGVTRVDVANEMIAAFKAAKVPAIGFVNGAFAANDRRSPQVMAAWRAAGLELGNHTFSHLHLSEIGAQAFLKDVDKGESFVKGAPKVLRYPFLDEAKDEPAVRDATRAGLAQRGYRVAAVTLSFDDYAYNEPYVRCLAQKDDAAVKALEARYLASARVDAERARAITKAKLGRDVPHVLLLHIGVFGAKMMPRLLAQYQQMGFSFASLDAVQKDPFYAGANDLALPGPSPTVEALSWGMSPPMKPKLPLPGAEICPAKK